MKNKIIKTLLVISLINTYLPLNAFWPFAKKYSHKDVPLSFVEEFYNNVSKLPWTRQVQPLEIALAKLAFEDAKLEEMTATDSRSLITKEDQRYYEEIENLSALITTNTDQLDQILNNLPGIKQSPENLIFLITTIDEIPSIHQRAYDITSQFQQKQLAIIRVHSI